MAHGTPSPSFWSDRSVRVLGGSGFLGRHLVHTLVESGAKIRTLSLPGPGLGLAGVDEWIGDATDPATVKAALDGGEIVFLAAGPVGIGCSRTRGMSAHSDALERVLNALPLRARLVLTSSIVTVGATRRGDVLTEDAPFPNDGLRVGYVRGKKDAEDAALNAAAAGRDVVVVNPGYLFGPNDPGPSVMGDLCVNFWRGRLAVSPVGGINAADVRDVAAGHLLAAERGVPGHRYIFGGENVRFAELFSALAHAAHLRRAVLPGFRPSLPAWAHWSLAAMGEQFHRLTGKEPFASYEQVRMARLCWFVSSARAETELGYTRRPLAETLTDTYSWHAARTRVGPRGLNRVWLRPAA